jgi:hypothetical protein
MRLETFTSSDIKEKFKLPPYQRKRDSRVNEIALYMAEKGSYSSLPIVINSSYEIIDGGHRCEGFLIAVEKHNIRDEIQVLIDDNADRETFLRLNKTKQVPFSHKVKIHDSIIFLEKKIGASFTLGSSTKSSIGAADFARSLYIINVNKERVKQCSQKEAFDLLDNIGTEELITNYTKINNLKNRYLDKIPNDKKFSQKIFLYLCYLDMHIDLSDSDINRIATRMPISIGGDIGLPYNKELFIEAYNYNKKTNRLTINIFNKGKNNEI